jgi:hypothetical protein
MKKLTFEEFKRIVLKELKKTKNKNQFAKTVSRNMRVLGHITIQVTQPITEEKIIGKII